MSWLQRPLLLLMLSGQTLLPAEVLATDDWVAPIALSQACLEHVTPGEVLEDVFNGTLPGNFGWLSWSGSPSTQQLLRSLSKWDDLNSDPEGDDAEVAIQCSRRNAGLHNWIAGKPGVSNSRKVRGILQRLVGCDLVVPVWDQARGGGRGAEYRICAFARVRLVAYHLPRKNRLRFRFLG